jgi:hypothetical protein
VEQMPASGKLLDHRIEVAVLTLVERGKQNFH